MTLSQVWSFLNLLRERGIRGVIWQIQEGRGASIRLECGCLGWDVGSSYTKVTFVLGIQEETLLLLQDACQN